MKNLNRVLPIKFKAGTEIVNAYYVFSGHPIKVLDPTVHAVNNVYWFFREYCGQEFIVMADYMDQAFEEILNAMRPIPVSDLFEAYGFETAEEFQAAYECNPDSLELLEGHYYQNQAEGTGIVFCDPDCMLREISAELLDQCAVSIRVRKAE